MDKLTFALDHKINAMVYVDYENLLELLKHYGQEPINLNFYQIIKDRILKAGFHEINWIVYGNFEKQSHNLKQQTHLRNIGFETRHCSVNGKNSGDLELTVDALRTLYKNPSIQTFVIISSDRDMIPLLKAIKYEGRTSYVFSTKIGFNTVVAEYADYHEYIEDIFELNDIDEALQPKNPAPILDLLPITQTAIERAKEVSRYFYASNIFKKAQATHEPIGLVGYIQLLTRPLKRSTDDLLNDFKLAHHFQYLSIYTENKRLYLKPGVKMPDFQGLSESSC